MPVPGAANLVTLLDAVAARHPVVAAHGRRVAAYAVRLAAQYGLGAPAIESIRVGALLHDIGKIQVPSYILAKPGRLTEREWVKLRTHPERGCDLVDRMGFEGTICEIVLYHHERYDGTGYPHRVEGSAIDWAVRLVSVADAFDAITSPRPYRRTISVDAARSLLAREAGSRFCPWAVSGLLSLPRELLQPVDDEPGRAYLPDGCPAPAAAMATRSWQASTS
ncbi:MAG: HD domain-containing protein [Acidobacteria bacterium]|nr:HD domain-containing protein [Acidobacteriota bacterium]